MSDPRFELIDAFDRKWLKLKDGASIDHETEPSITVTVTASDSNGGSASTEPIIVTVTNVNEPPTASGDSIPAVIGTAGEPLEGAEVNLLSAFSDPDGDVPARYTVSGDVPSWLTFSILFGEDDDGNPTATGLFTGTPPAGADSATTVALTINAFDAGGLSASASVRIIVDDEFNDDITAVDLLNDDGDVVVEAEVKESDETGALVLGEIRVTDADDPGHPSGTHRIQVLKGADPNASPKADPDDRFEVKYDEDGVPWLAIKAGSTFDHEKNNGLVDITIRAVDLDGATNVGGTAFTGNIEYRTITVFVTDQNDAPKANAIGNWWVTAEEGLRSSEADDIGKGEWLTFSLETTGNYSAFTDPDGDPLTYSLSGPSILEINEDNGQITNAKGALPIRGNHKFTVTATDPDDKSVSRDFYVAIALSGDGTDATANDDNEEPDFSNVRDFKYTEGDGDGTVVATFTVTDDENDLGHHPFALDKVTITQLVIDFDEGADLTVNLPLGDDPDMASDRFASVFSLSEPRKSGKAWTYDLIVRDDPMTRRVDETDILDHDEAVHGLEGRGGVVGVEVTVTATNNVDTDLDMAEVQPVSVTETIDIDIEDRNEAPEVAGTENPMTPAGTLLNPLLTGDANQVEQSEEDKIRLYINLHSLWEDPDDNDRDDDLTFTAKSSTPWITIVNGDAVEWGDISDSFTWGGTDEDGIEDRTVGGEDAPTDDDVRVVIVEIDRTGSNNGQVDMGSFTLTARDDRGGPPGTLVVPVTVDDANLPIPANATPPDTANVNDAVRISGSPREGATLRATFDDDKDPDLRGDAEPALVLYRWFRDDVDSGGTVMANDDNLFRVSTDSTYKLAQDDFEHVIRVVVQHYEIVAGQLVSINTVDGTSGGAAIPIQSSTPASRPVSNTPDAGTGSITILTTASNALVVQNTSLSITDGDYTPRGAVPDSEVTITWEVSDNGRTGWTKVDQLGDDDADSGRSLELRDGTGTRNADNEPDGNGQGKYYRAVATYDANGASDDDAAEKESVYSDPVRVADIRDGTTGSAFPTPAITGSPSPGGTVTVSARGDVDVQWQVQVPTTDGSTNNWVDLTGATGTTLTLTEANAGQTLRAVVSYESTDPNSAGVTAIVATAARTVGGTSDPASPVKLKDHDIEASVEGTGHGPDLNGDAVGAAAGHNLSLRETVDLRSLFQDPDSARLTFSVDTVSPATPGNPASAGLGGGTGLGGSTGGFGSQYVFDAPGGLLTFNTVTGELTFDSDVYRGHDGTSFDEDTGDHDGTGNIITLRINANDSPGGTIEARDSQMDATVNLRINVAPQDIEFMLMEDGAGEIPETGVPVDEHVGANHANSAAVAGSKGQFIAHINVVDENFSGDEDRPGHKFGTHEFTVSDDRFMVVHNGYDPSSPRDKDGDDDGSTWELRLKPGVTLDYEAEFADDMDATIEVTLTATDGGGLSTPTTDPETGAPMSFTVTINVGDKDAADGDTNHPLLPGEVPGLEDNESNDDNDKADGGDSDTDGGADPSMDAMMMSTLDDGLF